ncbi:Plug domain-containing protein [Costertonia aggregata]|uniref:Plug domain-containing protein n=1 Tax=Costertonia aggregata TaxID=343403 RepID=A0A7H9AVD7_9FLAO|nr:Plug domain-containing protein [Costertonia aggregata]QLG47152.1 Plug domain-containing protein [Costertonia aggregata]
MKNKSAFFIMLLWVTIINAQTQKVEVVKDLILNENQEEANVDTSFTLACKAGAIAIQDKALDSYLPFRIYTITNDDWALPQDMYNAIIAKVPGTTVYPNTNTGTNAIPNIRMRGDTNTVVIVDGVRYDASILNSLNVADIESVKISNNPVAENYFRYR